jgi:signal recognition particle GTPase
MSNELEMDTLQTNEEEDSSEAEDNGDETGSEPDYKALFEKEQAMRQGLVKKVKALEKSQAPIKSEEKSVSSNSSDEKFDKLELKMLDKDLTEEQVKEILTIKKAKGVDDVGSIYQSSLVQSWLKEERSKVEKEQRINNNTPKSQNKNVAPPTNQSRTLPKADGDWAAKLPPNPTIEEISGVLEDGFFGDER